jgi:hypothetical protein
VEILRVHVFCLVLEDVAELELTENIADLTLRWGYGPHIKEVLPIIKIWRHLRRLTLDHFKNHRNIITPLEVLSDFIMEMKHLSHLHIVPQNKYNYAQLEILRDKVNELILPRRPYFKFDISR